MGAPHRETLPDPFALARIALAPWRWLTGPRFFGLENLPPDRPVLLAGNHTVMGLLDVPLMLLGLREQRGLRLRPLGDHIHFRIPGWRDFLRLYGTVEGTPEACRALMRAGESILVFPGGAREVFKRKGEKYRLLWANRTGFVRLAIEHGYPIVPFAAVGAEECYEILADAGDLLRLLPPLRLVPRADEIPPLVRGVGLSAIPRPQRFYFHFGQPIETRHLMGLEGNERICVALREQVRASVDAGIAFLLSERERDPDSGLLARLVTGFRGSPLANSPRKATEIRAPHWTARNVDGTLGAPARLRPVEETWAVSHPG
jgi:1-acyl-sn-glycerol-3-phosphate acyltransferase